MLDAVSMALRRYSAVKLEKPPRMADFAKWAAAAAPALGWTQEQFVEAYARNRKDSERALFENPFAEAIGRLDLPFEGTTTALLAKLNELTTDEIKRKADLWPQSPQSLSSDLRRIAPALRRAGLCDVRFNRSKFARCVVLDKLSAERVGKRSSPSSSPSSVSETLVIPCVSCRPDDDGLAPRLSPASSTSLPAASSTIAGDDALYNQCQRSSPLSSPSSAEKVQQIQGKLPAGDAGDAGDDLFPTFKKGEIPYPPGDEDLDV